jgi:hypothetical protein
MFHYLICKNHKLLLVITALLCSTLLFAQVGITGPKCVLTSLVYQYDIAIKGAWTENNKVSICVDGGVLTENGSSCIEKQSVTSVKVQWSEGKTTGKITVTSGAGTSNINVNISASFNPGFIETTDKQTISYNKLPPSLSCTQASGGNCAPSFSYQWEQSLNKLEWKEISGATGRNLAFDIPLTQTTFFRRKAFEAKSNTTGYTNQVAVFVIPGAKKN